MDDNNNMPSHSEAGRDERMPLSDGFTTSRAFFNLVLGCVRLGLTELAADGIYTAEQLFGREVWKQLSRVDRQLAGRCIAHAVAHQLLPLELVRWKHEYPCHYRLA